MANILDILQDAKITVKNNAYISWGYITYQVCKGGILLLVR